VKAPNWRLLAGCVFLLSAATVLAPARALPPPAVPTPAASPTPTLPPAEGYLPAGSPIDFVLDDKVDSAKTPVGTIVHMHLANALVVGGIELAPAKSPATMRVVDARHAMAPDIDGSVQVLLDPVALAGHGSLPVTASHEYLTIDRSAGRQETGGIEDSAIEIFLPAYAMAKLFRKGSEMTLPRGTILRAHTAASIDASHPPNVVIATPAPFAVSTDVPHSEFTMIPLYTAPPTPMPRPKSTPKPSPSPSPPPTPDATASA